MLRNEPADRAPAFEPSRKCRVRRDRRDRLKPGQVRQRETRIRDQERHRRRYCQRQHQIRARPCAQRRRSRIARTRHPIAAVIIEPREYDSSSAARNNITPPHATAVGSILVSPDAASTPPRFPPGRTRKNSPARSRRKTSLAPGDRLRNPTRCTVRRNRRAPAIDRRNRRTRTMRQPPRRRRSNERSCQPVLATLHARPLRCREVNVHPDAENKTSRTADAAAISHPEYNTANPKLSANAAPRATSDKFNELFSIRHSRICASPASIPIPAIKTDACAPESPIGNGTGGSTIAAAQNKSGHRRGCANAYQADRSAE